MLTSTRGCLPRKPCTRVHYVRGSSATARTRRDKLQLSLLYLDLDRFKEVNDTLGHAAGDLLLKKVARRLWNVAYGQEIPVSHFGGDEFVILLENID